MANPVAQFDDKCPHDQVPDCRFCHVAGEATDMIAAHEVLPNTDLHDDWTETFSRPAFLHLAAQPTSSLHSMYTNRSVILRYGTLIMPLALLRLDCCGVLIGLSCVWWCSESSKVPAGLVPPSHKSSHAAGRLTHAGGWLLPS